MKSGEEILLFIKTIRARTKTDDDEIVKYCSKIGVNVEFYDSVFPSARITFVSFKHWVETGLPDIGNVVVYDRNHTIGIVSSVGEKSVLLGVSLLGEDGLIVSGLERAGTEFRYANDDEVLKLHRAIARKGFTWNIWRNKLVKSKFSPRANLIVRFRSYIDDEYGVGVFREINAEGKLVMYCVVYNEDQVRFSLYEVVGDADRYQLAPATKNDIAVLKNKLGEEGMMWNGYYGRMEPFSFVIDYGEKYYYINDKGEIKNATKNDSSAYRKRLACGNHFTDIKHAEDLKEKMYEYRKQQLSSPDLERRKS